MRAGWLAVKEGNNQCWLILEAQQKGRVSLFCLLFCVYCCDSLAVLLSASFFFRTGICVSLMYVYIIIRLPCIYKLPATAIIVKSFSVAEFSFWVHEEVKDSNGLKHIKSP